MSFESNTPVDPRVQIELEKLNTATDDINKFEQKLDESKCEFKKLLEESAVRIKESSHKLGNSIQAAKPYYEARLYATQIARHTQQAATNYEKAKSIHAAAKEMVYLAELGLGEKSTLDTACQEMLSHAASRVNKSQIECMETKNALKICELKQEVANNRVAKLQSQLKSAIKASRPYYETRANYNGLLKTEKEKIANYEAKVSEAKMSYTEALKNLEQISEEIHKMRQERKLLSSKYNLNISSDQQSNKSSSFDNEQNSSGDSGTFSDFTNQHQLNNKYSSQIDSCDDYLAFPSKLSIKSSPIRQRHLDKHDCPHLLRDFEHSHHFTGDIYDNCNDSNQFSSQYFNNKKREMPLPASSSGLANLTDDIEQWTEIRLSNSESTSSGYSHHDVIDDRTPDGGSDDTSSEDNRKITCGTVFNGGRETEENENAVDGKSSKKKSGEASGSSLTSWISRSNSMKSSSRRQSLDILIDAGDRVKDVFTSSFQKVGKTLERRNSESEVNNENNDFFSFTRSDKEGLSDEQVENLLLNEDADNDNIDVIVRGVNDISK